MKRISSNAQSQYLRVFLKMIKFLQKYNYLKFQGSDKLLIVDLSIICLVNMPYNILYLVPCQSQLHSSKCISKNK